jgi:lon-related putative ATP-dependent protease
MTDQEFSNLPKSEQDSIRSKQNQFADEIKTALQETHKLERNASKELATLEKEVAEYTINNMMSEMEERYIGIQAVQDFLHAVKNDILENLAEFLLSHKPGISQSTIKGNDFLKRYEVNILVDNSAQQGAPVVFENNPTYNNLVGRVEKESIMGTLVTDFTMIRSGALHNANGGYLIIRADELFKNYFSWDAVKRAIRNKEIMIEEAADQLGYLTTETLKPEAIPLQVKIILVGNPLYYYLLYAYDPDFRALFKIKADFDIEMDRSEENLANYIFFVRQLTENENLALADHGALAKLIEFGSRLAGNKGKLSSRFDDIADILREANHYTKQDGAATILASHIKKAIEEKIYRSNLIQEKLNELIEKKQIFIDFEGSKTGQVNGLSIIDLGDISFGKPSRITCTVNLGRGGIIAIEREAELSGPIHTKGVLILTGYLAEKYFQDVPVSLSARLVFEQSYAEIEGDSASSAELYAILSNLSRLPIKQGIAVTGSVNQKGEVQAIGGVNEKIEGYFEVCKIVGLTGEQGVLIPSANIPNLMLKEDIVEAVGTGKFRIWAVDTIDDGIEILTGLKAGTINEEGTVFSKVNDMIFTYADKLKKFGEETFETGKTDNQIQWVTDIV